MKPTVRLAGVLLLGFIASAIAPHTLRKAVFLVCVLALPSISLAKTDQSSWAILNGLQAGQSIQILDTSSKTHSGTFVSVSETAISYRLAEGEQAIQKPEVRSVKLMQNKHRLRNTLIGAGIGAGAGAAAAGATGASSGGWFTGYLVAAGAAIGAVSGAVVGALLPSHSTIYKVSSH